MQHDHSNLLTINCGYYDGDISLLTKIRIVKPMVFPLVIYGCESWNIKKAECQRIGALELWCWRRQLRVPWTARISNSVNPKGNQPWIFIGRTDAGAEAPTLKPPDVKSWLIGKNADAGKIGGKVKWVAEDEMVRSHHQLNGHEFEQTLGGSWGCKSLFCCSMELQSQTWLRGWTTMTERQDVSESSCGL